MAITKCHKQDQNVIWAAAESIGLEVVQTGLVTLYPSSSWHAAWECVWLQDITSQPRHQSLDSSMLEQCSMLWLLPVKVKSKVKSESKTLWFISMLLLAWGFLKVPTMSKVWFGQYKNLKTKQTYLQEMADVFLYEADVVNSAGTGP